MKNEVTHAPASKKRSAKADRSDVARSLRRQGRDLHSNPYASSAWGNNAALRDTVVEARNLTHDTLLDVQPLMPMAAEDDVTALDIPAVARPAARPSKDKKRMSAKKLRPAPALDHTPRRIKAHTVANPAVTGVARARFAKAQTVTAMANTPAGSLTQRMMSPRALRRVAMAAIAIVAVLHPTTRAVAENVVNGLSEATPGVALSDPRDPKEFVSDLAIVMPRPTIVLTRQDAVAQELLKFSRTMSTQDVLRTAQAISEEAERLGYDPLLLLALIHIESFYDHLALSPVGAEGLMQLMPPTAEWMAGRLQLRWDEGHTFDPVLNVRLGSQYLAYLHREFGRMDYALTAYNRGPHATRYLVDRFGRLPPPIYDFYAAKVLGHYEKLKAMYGKLPMG